MDSKFQRLNLIGLIAAFSLSVAAFLLVLVNVRSQKWGTVDMQALLQDQSQQLAKAYPNGSVPPGMMQQVVEDIKTLIQNFSQEQKITLLAKGAVLSGDYHDYTQEFLSKSAHINPAIEQRNKK